MKNTPFLQKSSLSVEQFVSELIDRASKILPLVWPLENYIPSNPLKDLENVTFEGALDDALRRFSCQKKRDPLMQRVNQELIKWCQTFLDDGQASIPLPGKHKGFYQTWIDLAVYDKHIHCQCVSAKQWLLFLPPSPEQAMITALEHLDIPQAKYVEFLMCTLAHLPGWAGYLKWASSSYGDLSKRREWLTEFLAVRLCMTWSFVLAGHPFSHTSWTDLSNALDHQKLEKVKASERTYHENLLRTLGTQFVLFQDSPQALAQFVFCIDVRSESLRKEIEQLGMYETYGVAGFFNLPIAIKTEIEGKSIPSCPVLLKAQHEVREEVRGFFCAFRRGILRRLNHFYHSLKDNFATPFALVEMLGGLMGIWMGAHVLFPRKTETLKRLFRRMARLRTESGGISTIVHTIPLEQQLIYAESFLQLIGLTKRFSPYVILCGHTSQTKNNPYASALECGACGGNGGGMNARILAEILNSSEIRHRLAKRGMSIPLNTCFMAAEHDTTTDIISFYTEEDPRDQVWLDIQRDAELAALRNRLKRAQVFHTSSNQKKLSRSILQKSIDWSETRPEWGLVGNAAFVIGDRGLTKGVDLDNRCFLHSYAHREDFSGKVLESILTAPVLVAQWINAHYFFSSFDPILFGAGSKITHNIVGKMGAMQGNGSDLMFGLPMQSMNTSDDEHLYLPMRLLVVVCAPLARLKKILASHKTLQNIFYNKWSKLAVLCPENRMCYHLSSDNQWKTTCPLLRSK